MWEPLEPIPPSPYKISVPNALSEFRVMKERGYKLDEWYAMARAERATILGFEDEQAKLEYWMDVWSRPKK